MLLDTEIAEAKTIVAEAMTGRATCTITRPNSVDNRSIDTESGQPIGDAPDPVELYDGDCFLDERGESVKAMLGSAGDMTVAGMGVLHIPRPDEQVVFDSETDEVSVTFNGVRRTGRIIRPQYLLTQTRLLTKWHSKTSAV